MLSCKQMLKVAILTCNHHMQARRKKSVSKYDMQHHEIPVLMAQAKRFHICICLVAPTKLSKSYPRHIPVRKQLLEMLLRLR